MECFIAVAPHEDKGLGRDPSTAPVGDLELKPASSRATPSVTHLVYRKDPL